MNGLDLHNLSYTQRVSTELLLHESASMRILALRSFTYSSSSIMPLPFHLLLTLRQILPCFHAETDSAARNEFCSIIKKLFSRIKAVMHRLTKRSSVSRDVTTQPNFTCEEDSKRYQDHAIFISWYVELLQKELQPTASYPRHISALKVLQLLNDSGLCSAVGHNPLTSARPQKSSQLVELYKSPFIYLLLELVMNPFDDVRTMAASLLHEHYATVMEKQTTSDIAELSVCSRGYSGSSWDYSALELMLQRSEALSRRTGRADYADGVGRLYHLRYLFCDKNEKLDDEPCERHLLLEGLISGLEMDIQVAHDNLQTAIASAPLHGHLIALRQGIAVDRHVYYCLLSSAGIS